MPDTVSTSLAQVNSSQETDTSIAEVENSQAKDTGSSSSDLPAELQGLVDDLAAVSAESDAASTPSDS